MMKIFDYIYYRMTKAYFKWDGRNGITSIIGVSMVQSMMIGNLLAFLFGLFFTKAELSHYSKELAFTWATAFIVFIIYNSKRYKNKYIFFKSYWRDETNNQKVFRGFLVILSLILPWISIIVMSIFRR